MEQPCNCILCSACNSQINRDIKAADKDKKFIIIPPSPTDDTSSQPSTPSIPPQIEFKLRMSIKQNKQTLPAIIISFNLEYPTFIDFRDKLESFICEQVGLIYKNEYTLAYKSYSESGAGTLLGNEEAFDEFLKDYQSMTTGNKKVVVVVTLKEASKKQSRQESDEGSDNDTQNTKSKSQPPSKKRAKKRTPKEADLDENEALIGSYVIKLNDKYICDVQNHKHCFIKEDRHLPLTNFAISLWAKEIVNKNTDLDTPPNHAMFSMMHSVKVTKRNSSNVTDDFINNSQMTTYSQYPYHSYYPQQMYYSSYPYYHSDYDSRRSSIISQLSDQSLSISSQTSLDHNLTKKTIPSMEDFLKNLDQEYGDGKFTCYLSVFEEQEILVNQLTRLSESEYISMGVTIIGRRQILRDEAKKYE
ncbi:hypothetical protein RclHR1_07760013 [Rhizophagus clarus]|nr:hypothetical protein RclHR1_01740004 [Rhizophagus clarus]GBC07898.1 hypothetical protein RclHR1_07760013 [Rhizophagus clarus]